MTASNYVHIHLLQKEKEQKVDFALIKDLPTYLYASLYAGIQLPTKYQISLCQIIFPQFEHFQNGTARKTL